MSLAAGKWIRLRPFADSSGQFRMVVINQCQSIQNNSNYCLESDESTWNDLIKLMLGDRNFDVSGVLLICLFFVWPASHFTLFNNQVLNPAKEHAVLNGLALLQYKGTT